VFFVCPCSCVSLVPPAPSKYAPRVSPSKGWHRSSTCLSFSTALIFRMAPHANYQSTKSVNHNNNKRNTQTIQSLGCKDVGQAVTPTLCSGTPLTYILSQIQGDAAPNRPCWERAPIEDWRVWRTGEAMSTRRLCYTSLRSLSRCPSLFSHLFFSPSLFSFLLFCPFFLCCRLPPPPGCCRRARRSRIKLSGSCSLSPPTLSSPLLTSPPLSFLLLFSPAGGGEEYQPLALCTRRRYVCARER
jgi:hypothetical protein